jgi:hypothetical protein
MEEGNPSFAFDFAGLQTHGVRLSAGNMEPVTDFFEYGVTLADEKYFAALETQS